MVLPGFLLLCIALAAAWVQHYPSHAARENVWTRTCHMKFQTYAVIYPSSIEPTSYFSQFIYSCCSSSLCSSYSICCSSSYPLHNCCSIFHFWVPSCCVWTGPVSSTTHNPPSNSFPFRLYIQFQCINLKQFTTSQNVFRCSNVLSTSFMIGSLEIGLQIRRWNISWMRRPPISLILTSKTVFKAKSIF